MVTIVTTKSGRVFPAVRNRFVRRLFRKLFRTRQAPVKRMCL